MKSSRVKCRFVDLKSDNENTKCEFHFDNNSKIYEHTKKSSDTSHVQMIAYHEQTLSTRKKEIHHSGKTLFMFMFDNSPFREHRVLVFLLCSRELE